MVNSGCFVVRHGDGSAPGLLAKNCKVGTYIRRCGGCVGLLGYEGATSLMTWSEWDPTLAPNRDRLVCDVWLRIQTAAVRFAANLRNYPFRYNYAIQYRFRTVHQNVGPWLLVFVSRTGMPRDNAGLSAVHPECQVMCQPVSLIPPTNSQEGLLEGGARLSRQSLLGLGYMACTPKRWKVVTAGCWRR